MCVGIAREWLVENVPCERHLPQGLQDYNRVPGSLLNGFLEKKYVGSFQWAGCVEHMPRRVLERELALELVDFDKRYEGEGNEK